MVDSSHLRVDVGELLRHPGSQKRVELEGRVPGLEAGLGRVTGDGAVALQARIEAVVEGIAASGTVSGTWSLECRRCLVEFESPFALGFEELFASSSTAAEEGFEIEGEEIDLVPAVRDAVLLAMPANPLHDRGCRGLCAECGQDLNVADCGHQHERIEARWEPLRRLRDQMGE